MRAHGFRYCFTPLPGVLFTFPSRYWCRYRSHGSIQAWRVVPPGSDRVSRARPYSGASSGVRPRVRLRGPNPVPPAFPCRSAPLDGSPPGAPAPGREALQPRGRYRLAPARSTVWPRSPFARRYSGNLDVDFSSSGYLDVSVPRVVPSGLCVHPEGARTSPGGFAHSETRGSKGVCP